MKIEKIVSFSLIVFIIFILGIFVFSKKPNNQIPVKTNITVLDISEVAKHNSYSSCWMVIGGKVYDVTKEINSHPGGARAILSHCGQESTDAWNSKDSFPARMHSIGAALLLKNDFVGDLKR